MNFFKELGSAAWATLTTNVPRVIFKRFTNIYHQYKTERSLSRSIIASIGGFGGAATFLLLPDVSGYFSNILTAAFSSGEIANSILTGTAGFWVFSSVSYNLTKQVQRVYSSFTIGDPNNEYDINDRIVAEIVDANTAIYKPDSTFVSHNWREANIDHLQSILLLVREKMRRYSDDSNLARRAMLKRVLLSALRTKDLTPLLEYLSNSVNKRNVRIRSLQNLYQYFTNIDPSTILDDTSYYDLPPVATEIFDNYSPDAGSDSDQYSEPYASLPIFHDSTNTQNAPLSSVRVFQNSLKSANELCGAANYSSRLYVQTSTPLFDSQKHDLIGKIKFALLKQTEEKQKDIDLISQNIYISKALGFS